MEPARDRSQPSTVDVVVVERSPVIALLLGQHLAAAGHRTHARSDTHGLARDLAVWERPVVLAALPEVAESLAVVALAGRTPTAVLHWSARRADLEACRRAGARGYAAKDALPEELLALVVALASGGTCFPTPPRVRSLPAPVPSSRRADDPVVLTARELEVVRLVLSGLTTRQVATRLGMAEQTAKNHLARIMVKAGVSSRVQLFAWAVGHDVPA